MSTVSRTTSGRTRRGAIVASLIAFAGVLAGCGSAGSYDAPSAAEDAYYDAGRDLDLSYDGGNELSATYMSEPEAGGPPTANADRSIIITGGLYITVDNPIPAADQAARIVQAAGGRVDARYETAPRERDGGSASLTLRIPSNRLDAVIDDLRELGTVDQFNTNSYDVTVEVTDLAARISTLRASTERIEALMMDAKDITDIIKLENELANRQAELESLEARQRGLSDQVSMSTIELSLTTEPVVIVDDSPENFWDGLQEGWESLLAFLSGALVVLGVALPWLALFALIIAAIVLAIRAKVRSVARSRAEQAGAAVAPAPPTPTPAAPQKKR